MKKKIVFFLGFTISLCGDWFSNIAFGWLVVHESGLGEDRGQNMYAICRAITAGVIVLSSGIAGVAIHRRGPFVTGMVASGLLCLLAVAHFGLAASELSMWPFITILVILRISFGLVHPSRDSAEQLVLKSIFTDFSSATWIRNLIYYMCRAAFSLLAGIALKSLGLPMLFLLDAMSYAAMVFLLYYIWKHHIVDEKQLEQYVKQSESPESFLTTYKRCVVYAWRRHDLRLLMLLVFILEGLCFTVFNHLPKIVKSIVDDGGYSYGLVNSAAGVGGVCGVLVGYLVSRHAPRALSVLYLIGVLLIPFSIFNIGRSTTIPSVAFYYGLSLLAWGIFATINRIHCSRDQNAKFALQANTLVTLGVGPLVQMFTTIGFSKLGFNHGMTMQTLTSIGLVLVILLLTTSSENRRSFNMIAELKS